MQDGFLPQAGRFEDLQPAIGYFGVVDPIADGFVVTGWMLAPFAIEFRGFALYLNQFLVGWSEPQAASREFDKVRDRGEPWIFNFKLPEAIKVTGFSRIEVVGWAQRQAVRRLTTLFRSDLNASVPTPPEQLMYRVTGNRHGKLVKESGLRCMSNFLDAAGQHRDLGTVRTLLDWGCGCGRVTAHLLDFLARYDDLEIHGCDIDREAIAWCNQHLPRGHFRHIDPYPPLPFPAASFDLVVSCSVFTHLNEETQQLWLREIKRVLTPAGLFLASINSNFANSPVPGQGISDQTRDSMMDGIAPAGYYRGTVQTKEYTTGLWKNDFDILDFVSNGIEGSQDLVVMRNPA